ncbi:GIY-YIG nuclease family protein [Clostridiaceae bacterium 35-E11]
MKKENRKGLLMAYKERKITGGIYAIRNTTNGKMLLLSTSDLQGCKNRFQFSQKTGACVNMQLQKDWKELGGNVFAFEILEEIEKKDIQTLKEFREDIKVLEELWIEKLKSQELY